ncbi:hypothetical protein [Streptomyces canus]|uniref:hypothetical protein n=1 Tax=Streptomyces canus TaxID=58343 RepID=UPI003714D6A8
MHAHVLLGQAEFALAQHDPGAGRAAAYAAAAAYGEAGKPESRQAEKPLYEASADPVTATALAVLADPPWLGGRSLCAGAVPE